MFFLVAKLGYAQSSKIDSLISILKSAKEDTNKVDLLNNLAEEYRFQKPDSAIIYGSKALVLAKKINWDIGIGYAEYCIGTIFFDRSNFPMSIDHCFKALATWESIQKTQNNSKSYVLLLKSRTLGRIGTIYDSKGDYSKALEYDFKALKITEELGNKLGIAKHLGNIGNIYDEQGDTPKALDYISKH